MKKVLLFIAALAILPATASAAIRNSRHDLSSGSTTTLKSSGTSEICIFCHTPHGASSTLLLWNRANSSWSTYVWGATNTSTGTGLPGTPGGTSPSKRCLSCHDGSVALGSVANAGGGAAGTIAGLGGVSGVTDASGKLLDTSGYTVGYNGSMSGHHPVWIPYAGTGQVYNTATSSAKLGAGYYYPAQTNAACTAPSGACTTGPSGTAVQIYGAAGAYGIECGSCHDVHNESGNARFLRVDNAASALCLACHNK